MAGIINWNRLEKTRRPGHYRRRAHRKNANKKFERAKKLKPTGGSLK